jgi:hypothetical protein
MTEVFEDRNLVPTADPAVLLHGLAGVKNLAADMAGV